MRLRTAPLLLALAVPGLLAVPHAGAADTSAVSRVVVQGAAAAAAVEAAGGTVTRDLPIVDGVAATVPAAALPRLQRSHVVTPDDVVQVQAGDPTNDSKPANPVFRRSTGADELNAKGITGKGVRVALVDTGVAPVGDLAGRLVRISDPHQPNRLLRGEVDCVDLSGSDSCADEYGHGTFMAGLIAGSGAASGGAFAGVAPGADIVSIKIAGADGSADVSKVLAAVQWAVSFKDTYGIRVLNLSLGTNSRAPYQVDPLNYAVQRAWRAGLVVVVSSSNRGPAAGTISKPADDPLVLTVGAVDDRETPAISDDRLPSFSGRGPTAQGLAKPDVVAPGGRVIGLRAPGSTIERLAPGGGIDATYRRGSGTSMSAAITSGLTALLLQAQPTWTPDRVKFATTSTARKVAVDDPLQVGRGLVHAPSALAAGPGLANLDFPGILSDLSGSIDDSRGDVRTTGECGDSSCTVESGETAQRRLFDDFDAEQYGGEWTGSSWYSSQWVSPFGSSWYGSSWYQNTWEGSSWYGSSWYGSTDNTFYGSSFAGSSWYGAWS